MQLRGREYAKLSMQQMIQIDAANHDPTLRLLVSLVGRATAFEPKGWRSIPVLGGFRFVLPSFASFRFALRVKPTRVLACVSNPTLFLANNYFLVRSRTYFISGQLLLSVGRWRCMNPMNPCSFSLSTAVTEYSGGRMPTDGKREW
jgi:hypothetical protein